MIDLQGEIKVPSDPIQGSQSKPHDFLGTELSEEEYRETCANLAKFFLILKRWRDGNGKA